MECCGLWLYSAGGMGRGGCKMPNGMRRGAGAWPNDAGWREAGVR